MPKFIAALVALTKISVAHATAFYDILIKDFSNHYSIHIGFNDTFTTEQLKKTISNNEKIPADKMDIFRFGNDQPMASGEIVGPGDSKGRSLVINVKPWWTCARPVCFPNYPIWLTKI